MCDRHPITEHVLVTPRHTTSYLAAGPRDGPLIVFLHGWPELSISWRGQLRLFADLGFRAVAPDMRGYGCSGVPRAPEEYGQRQIVADMIELLDSLEGERAVWVGHDWGAPVAWSIASHHPDRCDAVAGCSVPYYTLERGLEHLLELIDRELYPEAEYPAGQWDYMRHYEESLEEATATFDANPLRTVKALFRRGEPERAGKPAYTASVRSRGGWFNGRGEAPELPLDTAVLGVAELHEYAAALTRNGFFGPNCWYMNHRANAVYAAEALDHGRLKMPTLFLGGTYDYTCECMTSRLAEPMSQHCRDLTVVVIRSGHWMAQEHPTELNAALVRWLAAKVDWTPGRREGCVGTAV